MKIDPKEMPYFDADRLPEPRTSYVAWIDVMGVRPTMSRSIRAAANAIFKLHVAAIESQLPGIVLYPVMDGVYVVSDKQVTLRAFAEGVFSKIAKLFITRTDMTHRFVVKGAVAYGPVINGAEVPNECSMALKGAPDYKRSILLGNPMIQALSFEAKAPPFGVYVHESARGFSPTGEHPIPRIWWYWWSTPDNKKLAAKLSDDLKKYYEWCAKHAGAIEYELDRIKVHEKMAQEYFSDFDAS